MRKRLSLSRIIKEDGQWAKGNEQVAAKAISFIQKQFTCENDLADMFLLNHVPTLVTKEMNMGITKEPVEEEMKRVVF
ncbi:hypothetical protein KY284_007841 [Solanum tuberosum]|nr:hypothetical protein KY284_007841 [Solanum tuberosum]